MTARQTAAAALLDRRPLTAERRAAAEITAERLGCSREFAAGLAARLARSIAESVVTLEAVTEVLAAGGAVERDAAERLASIVGGLSDVGRDVIEGVR